MEYSFAIASDKLPYLAHLQYEVVAPPVPIDASQTFIRLTVNSESNIIDLIYSGVRYGIDQAFASQTPTVDQIRNLWAEQKARLNESLPVTA